MNDKYTITTLVNGVRIAEERIADPFIHTRISIGWRDLLKSLLRYRALYIRVIVHGDPERIQQVLQLNEV